MATDKRVGGTTKLSGRASGALVRLTGYIDFEIDSDSSGEVIQLLNIPANTLILHVGAYVERAEGGTLTFDLGITGDDTDGFLDGVSGNAVASLHDATAGYVVPKLITSASIIAMIINNDADYAKIHVHAYCLDLNP